MKQVISQLTPVNQNLKIRNFVLKDNSEKNIPSLKTRRKTENPQESYTTAHHLKMNNISQNQSTFCLKFCNTKQNGVLRHNINLTSRNLRGQKKNAFFLTL